MSDRDRSAELKQLAHDVRNALNGVAVNLEVARSRAQRGVEVAQVAPFIETAVQQLEAASRLHKRYTDVVTGNVTGVVTEGTAETVTSDDRPAKIPTDSKPSGS